ncbi:Hypothetical protein NTJ_00248 [Nesidiocoris tenuis]|uniref:Uncharacterized protein n=1 Tax=Nesidiocoris tenuis TaxID=355587 RepID=A0ABN7AB23_9HEMI|nr:Hypothetical protein NTJ_00248 [Nesidiocoris tenuis]
MKAARSEASYRCWIGRPSYPVRPAKARKFEAADGGRILKERLIGLIKESVIRRHNELRPPITTSADRSIFCRPARIRVIASCSLQFLSSLR